MSDSDHHHHYSTFLNQHLSKQTSVFGLRLWVLIGIGVGAAFFIFFLLLSLWLTSKRTQTNTSSSNKKPSSSHHQPVIPIETKEIQEIKIDAPADTNNNHNTYFCYDSNYVSRARVLPKPYSGESASSEQLCLYGIEKQAFIMKTDEDIPVGYPRIHIDIGKGHRIGCPEKVGSSSTTEDRMPVVISEVSHLGWGHWYTLRELEASTNGFAAENVIGEGGYGIVYYGLLQNSSEVAVKNLLNNRGQAEKEFKVEVEAIGLVRHKNLVRLLGYCAEGPHRMLVYEYVDNGNLEQWLHGELGSCNPLTWEIRMHIILGTAKGLSYLHEGLEPKVIHRDIKSSNILLDRNWNPKVSDFGLAKLLGSESSYVTTRVMGTFGYVAPEYASSGMLNERSDVFSFGVLILELISGRNPVDYNRPREEVNLVEWLKRMVANKTPEGVLDPKLPENPSLRALKRTLLVALRCVDPNAHKRPRMGHVVHMLEADESSYRDDQRAEKVAGCTDQSNETGKCLVEQVKRQADDERVESEAYPDKGR